MSAIIVLCLLVGCTSAASVISAQPSSVSVQPGSTTDVKIIVDDLPDGISGYDLDVNLTDPSIAKIVNASFPSWVILSNITQISPASVRIGGVDLNAAVQPGSTNVLIATITVEGITTGTTQVVVNNVNMDDRNGTNVMAPPVTTAPPVSGNDNSGVGSYSGGGGGGGGISSGGTSSSGTAEAGTANVTGTTTAVPVVSTSLGSKQNGDASQVLVTTPATPPVQQIPSAGVVTPSAGSVAPNMIPGSMVIIAIIIAILAACVLLYFTLQKKL